MSDFLMCCGVFIVITLIVLSIQYVAELSRRDDQEIACKNICPKDGYIEHSLGADPTYCVCIDDDLFVKEAR